MPVTNATLQSAVNAVTAMLSAQAKTDLETLVGALSNLDQTNLAGAIAMAGGAANPNQKHAVMLAHRFFGVRDNTTIGAIKATVNGYDAARLNKEFKAVHKSWDDGKDALGQVGGAEFYGAVFRAPSFQYANSEERRVGVEVVKTSQKMLLKALISVKAVPTDSTARAAYQAWFGPYTAGNVTSQAHYQKVRDNIKALHKALCRKPVRLYYRGSKLPADNVEDKPEATANAAVSAAVASAWRATQVSAKPLYANSPFSHITFGTHAFSHRAGAAVSGGMQARLAQFGGGVNTQRVGTQVRATSGRDSLGGTIIHELSHYICDTLDEDHPTAGAKSYGAALCTSLPLVDQAKACNNADSYKYYCESFQ